MLDSLQAVPGGFSGKGEVGYGPGGGGGGRRGPRDTRAGLGWGGWELGGVKISKEVPFIAEGAH